MDHDDYRSRRNTHAIAKLREDLEIRSRAAGNSRRRRGKQVEELESDVLFLSLMNAALLDLLAERGVLGLDEVATRMRTIDALDGRQGDGLDVDYLAQDLGVAKPQLDKAKRFRESAGAKTVSKEAQERFRRSRSPRKRPKK
jgi:hypothetical protein